MSYENMGVLNGHSTGRILKETVRRAMVEIRNQRMSFEAQGKMGYGGTMDDVFTSADTKAQEIYLRAFQECFPGYGVIGEEDNLQIPSQNGYYFTVDPLDGTKAFVRRQSHGVATMVALVHGKAVVSAYIADINTGELYGYRPGSNKVFRISNLDTFEELGPGKKLISLREGHCMLREPLDKHSVETTKLVQRFKNHEVMGSSIGTWMARLWKGEINALILDPNWETPWDSTPVIGISQKLGFVFARPTLSKTRGVLWRRLQPELVQKKKRRNFEMVVIHKQNFHLLNQR